MTSTRSPRDRVAAYRSTLTQRWTRHSRSARFQAALVANHHQPADNESSRWLARVSDPNDPVALAARSETLRQAWRPPVRDRLEWLTNRCTGRTVLDVGCVAHSTDRMDDPSWLHARLAQAAAACIGVDVIGAGIEAMHARGFRAIEHDLANGVGPLASEGPFDVIVAGEIIEHLADLNLLFTAAAALLGSNGELLITTPNPYALNRFLAGRRGIVWENVDHISYAFPSGIAELAERHQLELLQAMTVVNRTPGLQRVNPGTLLRRLKRRLTGSQWRTVGFTTSGPPRARSLVSRPNAWLISHLAGGDRRLRGETFIYIVGRRAPNGTTGTSVNA